MQNSSFEKMSFFPVKFNKNVTETKFARTVVKTPFNVKCQSRLNSHPFNIKCVVVDLVIRVVRAKVPEGRVDSQVQQVPQELSVQLDPWEGQGR